MGVKPSPCINKLPYYPKYDNYNLKNNPVT